MTGATRASVARIALSLLVWAITKERADGRATLKPNAACMALPSKPSAGLVIGLFHAALAVALGRFSRRRKSHLGGKRLDGVGEKGSGLWPWHGYLVYRAFGNR